MNIHLDYGAWPVDGGGNIGSDRAPTPSHLSSWDNQRNGSQQAQLLPWQSDSSPPFRDFFAQPGFLQSAGMEATTTHTQLSPQAWPRREGVDPSGSHYAPTTPPHSSAVIDLTDTSLEPTGSPAPAPFSYGDERPRKRRRMVPSDTTHSQQQQESQASSTSVNETSFTSNSVHGSANLDAIDLTEVNSHQDLTQAISRPQEDAVREQRKTNKQGGVDQAYHKPRTAFSEYKCPICMDSPEDATSTVCGHLFCHKCIIDTLRFSEAQKRSSDPGTSFAANRSIKGSCPVCRKPLSRKDGPGSGRALVPLEIKFVSRKEFDANLTKAARDGARIAGKAVRHEEGGRGEAARIANERRERKGKEKATVVETEGQQGPKARSPVLIRKQYRQHGEGTAAAGTYYDPNRNTSTSAERWREPTML